MILISSKLPYQSKVIFCFTNQMIILSYSHLIKSNQFYLEIIFCLVCSAFDYLIYSSGQMLSELITFAIPSTDKYCSICIVAGLNRFYNRISNLYHPESLICVLKIVGGRTKAKS